MLGSSGKIRDLHLKLNGRNYFDVFISMPKGSLRFTTVGTPFLGSKEGKRMELRRYSLPSLLKESAATSTEINRNHPSFRVVSCLPSSITDSQLMLAREMKASGGHKRKRDTVEFLRHVTNRSGMEEGSHYSLLFQFGDVRSALYFWSLLVGDCSVSQTKKRRMGELEHDTNGAGLHPLNAQMYRLISYCLEHIRTPPENSCVPNQQDASTLDFDVADLDIFPDPITARNVGEKDNVILFVTVQDTTRIDCDLWWYEFRYSISSSNSRIIQGTLC